MENRQSRRKTKGKRESNFVVQGSILAVAGIIVRLIGILYRVPMTKMCIRDRRKGCKDGGFLHRALRRYSCG